jgi:signal transduction histidine kinase
MDTEAFLQRVRFVERGVAVPVKAVVAALVLYFLFIAGWFSDLTEPRSDALHIVRTLFLFYVAINVGAAFVLWGMNQVRPILVQRVVYCTAIMDAMGMGALTVLTGGFESILYWVFLGLIIRNAAVIPHAEVQIVVNIFSSGVYVLAGVLDGALAREEWEVVRTTGRGRMSETSQDAVAEPLETLILRVLLLLLIAACCYGIQVLLDRRRREEQEAEEFSVKQHQLQAAGRLAAEVAHQLKNPLGIINNAVYSLQRNVREGRSVTPQIEIIREEIERSDRILTELMGYAQLAEGKVEKISVAEELERAVSLVFPVGSKFDVVIHWDVGPALPPMLGQRGHILEIFVNLLANAREAMEGVGEIWISAHATDSYSVEVRIQDNGPGIPPELHAQLFEAYVTTKEKGTGLGLAIVRHNTEMYGGRVHLESEIGKGTTFVVMLPARTLMRLRR